jgi:anaerobic ribonucleoside-triphosphate reductase
LSISTSKNRKRDEPRVRRRAQSVTDDVVELLALRVTANFNPKVANNRIAVEDIQDSVEIVLIQAGYVDVARSYMDYRKKHAQLREIKKPNSTMPRSSITISTSTIGALRRTAPSPIRSAA